MTFQIDFTTALNALISLESWLNVKGEEILKFVSKQKYIYDAQDFIEQFCIEEEAIMKGNLNLISFHVTTNNDNCASIKKYGLMNLQDTINHDTPLSNYLRELGIKINLAKRTIEYKSEQFFIGEKDENSYPGSKGRYKNNVIRKLYEDYQINGFFCNRNALNYGGGVRHRPEILYSISAMLGNQEIVSNWIQGGNKCYVLKYFADISEFEYYTFNIKSLDAKGYEENEGEYELDKRKWLIAKALTVILEDMYDISLSEVFSYSKFSTKIPFEHIEILSDREYIDKCKIMA